MDFIEWLREVKGYNIYDDWSLKEQLSSIEADILWKEWDLQNYEEESE